MIEYFDEKCGDDSYIENRNLDTFAQQVRINENVETTSQTNLQTPDTVNKV